jgi:hypothetical protein
MVQALSADAEFLHSARGRHLPGRVHSVFDRTVNVTGSDGALFTLASREVDDAPDTLVLDAKSLGPWNLSPGDTVVATNAGLLAGGRIGIRLQGAAAWHAALPAYPADESRLRANVARVRAQLGERPIASAPAHARTGFACEMATVLERRALLLCGALREGDAKAAVGHGRSMIGLGPGLTPSGDDFLVGLFAVLHVPQSPCSGLAPLCRNMAADAQRQTHAISAAALQAAARGRVRKRIEVLLREMMTGTRERVDQALGAVLAIGSSSGTDIAAGVACGFECQLQRRQ